MCGYLRAEYGETITSLSLLAAVLFVQPKMQLALWAANTYLLALSFSAGLLSVFPICTPVWDCSDASATP